VTLRARLAVAFAGIVLAPMLVAIGALAGVIPEASAATVSRTNLIDRAGAAVRSVVAARCRQLAVTAEGLARAASASGESFAVTPDNATGPWAVCGRDPSGAPLAPTGLAARAEIPGSGGDAYAVQPLDDAFLAELSGAAGTRLRLSPDGNLPTHPDQPLRLELASSPARAPGGTSMPLLLLSAGFALLVAVLIGWSLSSLATRPLRYLASIVDRAASGDLSARSVLGGRDETGRLGRGVDRLISNMQETQRLSITDPLTSLGNARHLADRLRLEIERASRFRRALGVLALDVDRFKSINDQYGHRAGDAVLVEFAGRLRRAVREVDVAFRPGGEEFVILLPETDISGSLTAARRIGDAVRDAPFPLDGPAGAGAVPITVSVGVAVYPRHARTGVDLLEAADQALYAAKAAGRDTFVLAETPFPAQSTPDLTPSVVAPCGQRPRQ
jgi:diguanylate cyclase (GGDEF)-like protein